MTDSTSNDTQDSGSAGESTPDTETDNASGEGAGTTADRALSLPRRRLLRAGAAGVTLFGLDTATSTHSADESPSAIGMATAQSSDWSQQAKLAADDGDDRDNFGSVGISKTGNTAVIGALGDEDPNGDFAGSAYVFSRDGGEWNQQAKLAADDGDNDDQFGSSVAVSGSGDTAVIGANTLGFRGNFDYGSESAYVFSWDGGEWNQRAKFAAGDGNDGFGSSVGISGDGDTAVIGAPTDEDPNGPQGGSAYVFSRDGGEWNQQAKLAADDGDGYKSFGTSVELSESGDTVVIGARQDSSPNGHEAGSAYVFSRDGREWNQQAKLAADDGDNDDQFGSSVAVSGSGDTAVIGAKHDEDPNGTIAGSVYVFHQNGREWSQQVKLAADDGNDYDELGFSVSVSWDGNVVMIGSVGDEDPNGDNAGSAYVFGQDGDEWSQQAKLAADDGDNGDSFGSSLMISGSGDTAVIGAPNDEDPNGDSAGSAYVFSQDGDAGGTSITASIDVTPENPSVNQPITFDASASEAPDGIEEYRWDFTADGNTDETGQIVEFVFDEQDEYQVTLTVVDSDGKEAETTQPVEVGINAFEAAVKSKRRVAEEIDDVALYLSELEDVNSVLSELRKSLYDGELNTETTEDATTRLRLGEEISRRLLVKTGEARELEGVEDEQIAVDTTKFTIELGVGLALSAISLSEVAANSTIGGYVPDNEIIREKLDSAVEELVGYAFSRARQSEALSEIYRISREAYNGILDGQFDDGDELFEFVSDSVSATVANLTLMQTIEQGGDFEISSPDTSAFVPIDELTNVESSLGYLNTELSSEALVDQGLNGTLAGARDARNNATDLMNEIVSTTDTFLSELDERIDIVGIIKNIHEIIIGIINEGDPVDTVDALTLVSLFLLPKAAFAVTAVQAIGKFIGEISIRLMMTTHAWGIAGVDQGDPITLGEIGDIVPDVDETLADIEPVEDRWGEFI